MQIKAISLFSGIGAFEIAAQFVFGNNYSIHQFIEIDAIANRILRHWFPSIPIHCDIKTYHPPRQGTLGFPTIVVGGFPCTNTSSAGKREGIAGSESQLWWEMYRVVLESGADFVVIENPEGIINRGLRSLLGGLRMAGYQTEVELISAAEFGAPHRRNRVFIIAYSNHLPIQQRKRWQCWSEQIRNHIAIAKQTFLNSETQPGGVWLADGIPRWLDGINFDGWWRSHPAPIESGIAPRTAGRRECVNLYGKSIVPLQAAITLLRLKYLVELTTTD
jgi:DNA (cytosine-5)-methyltransferase 1